MNRRKLPKKAVCGKTEAKARQETENKIAATLSDEAATKVWIHEKRIKTESKNRGKIVDLISEKASYDGRQNSEKTRT